MPHVVLGTANLFGLVGCQKSEALLQGAPAEGFQRFDTAPSYGYGHCESAVGRVLADVDPTAIVTTKVGLLPSSPPTSSRRWIKSVGRRLPEPVQQRLRRVGSSAPPGHFGLDDVRRSVDLSLRRLGWIDRLMLHEVAPEDITDDLLSCLTGYVQRGDVGQLGVATSNRVTEACIMRAPEVFGAAHIAVGLLAAPVQLPATVTARVGHGLLGPGACDLRRIERVRDSEAVLAAQWHEATGATRWAGPDGLAAVMLARCATLGLTDVIVATSRPDHLPRLRALAGNESPVEPAVLALLDRFAGMTKAP